MEVTSVNAAAPDHDDPMKNTAFNLPARLAAKSDPSLIGVDEQYFATIAASLARSVAELTEHLTDIRMEQTRGGQAALERDLEIHRVTARLHTLRRYGLDLCLGHMISGDDAEPVYIGRVGLTDQTGRRVLIDWRSAAAEPFFGATHADPMGLTSRRRYRWTDGRITDYWDEVFSPDGVDRQAALDDQSAFIASLGSSRSPRMRDVLGTIAADQDRIIRAGSAGALVVDGGPGTGKTVVALHRAAYLLYNDPRLDHHRGGVLFIGPHQPYLDYVSDVLPSLGEEGVQTCTVRDLVPEGRAARPESDPAVARLKSSADLVRGIESAVKFYEEPPRKTLLVDTPWGEVRLTPDDWAEAFAVAEAGSKHNDSRDEVWDELVAMLLDRFDEEEVGADEFAAALRQNRELLTAFNEAWPLLTATDLVGDLWSVPAYLRLCAPWLSRDEVNLLQRKDPSAWTVSDLPLLDAARQRLGDPEAAWTRRRQEVALDAQRSTMKRVIDELIAADDSELMLMTSLRQPDLQDALIDDAELPQLNPDELAGPFAHVMVDEAQELTDAEWQMLLQRCPSRSFTIVGDRAQARHGFIESWTERLERVGLNRIELASLTINYRTPAEVMAEAEPVIRAVLPDANVPSSIRDEPGSVRHGAIAELDAILDNWLAGHAEGVACVIGAPSGFKPPERVRSLSPELSKGLEFDLVVLVDSPLNGSIEAAVDRYVAMTRATQQLMLLSSTGS